MQLCSEQSSLGLLSSESGFVVAFWQGLLGRGPGPKRLHALLEFFTCKLTFSISRAYQKSQPARIYRWLSSEETISGVAHAVPRLWPRSHRLSALTSILPATVASFVAQGQSDQSLVSLLGVGRKKGGRPLRKLQLCHFHFGFFGRKQTTQSLPQVTRSCCQTGKLGEGIALQLKFSS